MNIKKVVIGFRRSKELFPDDGPYISAQEVVNSVPDRWTAYWSLGSQCANEYRDFDYDVWIKYRNIAGSYPE